MQPELKLQNSCTEARVAKPFKLVTAYGIVKTTTVGMKKNILDKLCTYTTMYNWAVYILHSPEKKICAMIGVLLMGNLTKTQRQRERR